MAKLAAFHGYREDLAAAIDVDRAALPLLSPDEHLPLYPLARLNYAFHLQEAGQALRARDILDFDLDLLIDAPTPTSASA